MPSKRRLNSRLRDKAVSRRRYCGSILPIIAFLIVLATAFLALTTDVMRTIYAGLRLRSGAEAAALGAYSYYGSGQDTPSWNSAENNIRSLIASAGNPAWNSAPAGPDRVSGTFQTAITFNDADVALIPNPNDNNERLLQLTARRNGLDSIKLFFMPFIFAFSGPFPGPQPQPPQDAVQANTYRLAEVAAQPASRIGQGAPREAQPGTHAGNFALYAAFPLAISNQQFLAASDSANANTSYVIDLVSQNNRPPLQPGHIRGAFVNVANTGGSGIYYGTGIGDPAVSDLIHLLEYFQLNYPPSYIAPGIVERGSTLQSIDPNSPSFQARLDVIKSRLTQVNRPYFYIMPVVALDPFDPSTGVNNRVVGFAWMQLTNVLDVNGNIRLVMNIGESVAVRNATHCHSNTHVPQLSSTPLPQPQPPFLDRFEDRFENGPGLSSRGRGIVMAASLSPRVEAKKIVPLTAN